jgi:hypothetical protein
MSQRTEAAVARDAAALTLACAGLLWLVAELGALRIFEGSTSFVAGVLARSLSAPFQGALLAGLVAIPLHAAWTLARWRRDGQAGIEAYDHFGLWAQTLFTALGFLGTIVGVSLAVAGLEAAMTEGAPGALVQGLSTAFDTTFLGLTAAVLLMALRKIARWIGPQP